MDEQNIHYTPGPISLIFGSESPIESKDVSHHFPSSKRSLSCTSGPRQYIHHLSLLGCQLVDEKALFRTLGKKMRRESRLKELAICGTTPKLDNEDMMHLARGLNKNSSLSLLDLTGASFDARGLLELKPFFEKSASLEVLSLGENENIGDKGLQVILSWLQKGALRLRVLNLEACGIRTFPTTSPNLIESIGSLRILELGNNNIGDSGVESLEALLNSDDCKLKYLGLKNVNLGDRGLEKVADMLTTNRTLDRLNIQNNASITDVGACHLFNLIYNTDSIDSVVGSNHVLKNIEMKGCVGVREDILLNISMFSTQTIQFKVLNYFDKFGCASALGSLDSLLLPNILSFVAKNNGIDVLFRTVRSIPRLYNNPSREFTNVAPSESNPTSAAFPLNEGKSRTRRFKLHNFLVNGMPKIKQAMRCVDGGNRCKCEHVKKCIVPITSLCCRLSGRTYQPSQLWEDDVCR